MQQPIFMVYAVLSAAAMALPAAAHAQRLTTVHNFTGGVDGLTPVAGLLNVNGVLYGTTLGGGSGGCGTVFKITAAGESVVYAFSGSTHQPIDACGPQAALIYADGSLYGTTFSGGRSRLGTVFSIDLATGTEKVLHSFDGSDGANPQAALVKVGTTLYGTTTGGAQTLYRGSAFAINSAGVFSLLHIFTGSSGDGDGEDPLAALINVGGTLYGTTENGGANDFGTIYTYNIATGAYAIVYSFTTGPNAAEPAAALVDVGGILYGTTPYGGASANGAVYTFDPTTDTETVLYSFLAHTTDAVQPRSPLISAAGMLYGTTSAGGADNTGTVYAVNPVSGVESVVHSFDTSDGAAPQGAVVQNGAALYGTTSKGGAAQDGTVFKLAN